MQKRVGGRSEGTRKGLSFGTVRIVEKTDGHVMIKDAWPPHLLPRAFGILDGVDSHCDKYTCSKNSVIVIEKIAALQCAPALGLNLEGKKPFMVRSKHFYGSCYIFHLIG
ncbi:MAG: hypothetical protein QMC83_07895 [Thermodesulfovibrionales bacterium]|nr:hypothetical protein [Thermodesulfovibrionales bacterium]